MRTRRRLAAHVRAACGMQRSQGATRTAHATHNVRDTCNVQHIQRASFGPRRAKRRRLAAHRQARRRMPRPACSRSGACARPTACESSSACACACVLHASTSSPIHVSASRSPGRLLPFPFPPHLLSVPVPFHSLRGTAMALHHPPTAVRRRKCARMPRGRYGRMNGMRCSAGAMSARPIARRAPAGSAGCASGSSARSACSGYARTGCY